MLRKKRRDIGINHSVCYSPAQIPPCLRTWLAWLWKDPPVLPLIPRSAVPVYRDDHYSTCPKSQLPVPALKLSGDHLVFLSLWALSPVCPYQQDDTDVLEILQFPFQVSCYHPCPFYSRRSFRTKTIAPFRSGDISHEEMLKKVISINSGWLRV